MVKGRLLLIVSVWALGLFASSGRVTIMARGPAVRTFEFTYTAEVTNIPKEAKKVSIWLPYPTSDAHQEVTPLLIAAPYPTSLHRDPEYGNAILFLSAANPRRDSIRVDMKFLVTRREYVRRDFSSVRVRVEGDTDPLLKRWLQPDRLVPVDDRIRALARDVTRGKTADLEKVRAIYDYVVDNLTYDKSGTGWGRGDIYYACDVKRGNCTDFHALFIGLCRAVGIPAKFAIGFPLPPDRGQGEIAGYHCWAEFYLKGYGWVPVDASEANKHPEKREYFFGAHDENRVQFTIGRDIILDPPQAGEPLNYFIYPYVEVDGKPFGHVRKHFFYKDVAVQPKPVQTGSERILHQVERGLAPLMEE